MRDAPVRRFSSLTASPSSRRWSSVEERFACSTLSSLRASGSVKLMASIRSRGTPFDSIRQSVVIQSAAWSPLPWTNRTGATSAAADGVDAVCARAEKPRFPASKGSAPAPFNIVRRVRLILAPLVIFQYLSCALGALIATQRLDRTRLSQDPVRAAGIVLQP